MPTHHEQSSYTADGVAWRRTFTDIPLSQEIWDIIKGKGGKWEEVRSKIQKIARPELHPYFEARYKMTDKLLKEFDIRQVIEFGAGMSPRGMIMTADPDVNYSEVDLEDMNEQKVRLVTELISTGTIPIRPNLGLFTGNAVSSMHVNTVFNDATRGFYCRPIAIIFEGLLRYISLSDKGRFFADVRAAIERFGGVCLTPDVEFLVRAEEEREHYDQMARDMGIDVRENLWRDKDDMILFFDSCGIDVEFRYLDEMIPDLVCPARVGLTPDQVSKTLADRPYLILRPKRKPPLF